MKLEIDIDNFSGWWHNISGCFGKVPFKRILTELFCYEEFVHKGNDAIFINFLTLNIYLMFD